MVRGEASLAPSALIRFRSKPMPVQLERTTARALSAVAVQPQHGMPVSDAVPYLSIPAAIKETLAPVVATAQRAVASSCSALLKFRPHLPSAGGIAAPASSSHIAVVNALRPLRDEAPVPRAALVDGHGRLLNDGPLGDEAPVPRAALVDGHGRLLNGGPWHVDRKRCRRRPFHLSDSSSARRQLLFCRE